jgi:hypothetical protein
LLTLHEGRGRIDFYFERAPLAHNLLGAFWLESPISLIAFFVIYLLALRGAFVRGERERMIPSLILLGAIYPMIFIVWHADSCEVMRHSLVPAALLRIALIAGIVAGADVIKFALPWRRST